MDVGVVGGAVPSMVVVVVAVDPEADGVASVVAVG
jgi:hypothetical protein